MQFSLNLMLRFFSKKATNIIGGGMMPNELATLAGGCYWCLEAVFKEVRGVSKVTSGFTNGHINNPTYEQVCSGNSGHAEAIEINFDNSIVSYADLLEIFWKIHDPTTLNRQGGDEGTQYRSGIYYHDENQKKIANASKLAAEEAKLYSGGIVTEILKADKFYPAPDKHQNYYANNSNQGYCRAVIGPKLDKFKKLFREKLK